MKEEVTAIPIEVPEELPERLLTWYDQGHRELPWRSNPTPYYVWVSEIMLQQTRVEAVKPYFLRFVSALPDIPSLAEAEEEQLLKLWEGLGYYRRVRHLQAAAKVMVECFEGKMPNRYPLIRSLPGIGDYTAGAIASIAFGLPTPAVDGNVLRVLARVCEDYRDITKQSVKRDVAQALARIYPQKRAGDMTQSLMELGATVCIPNGTPHCGVCPLGELCLACRNRTVDELPVKTAKKPRKIQEMTVFVIESGGHLAVRKRSETGLLAGLWELPNCDGVLCPTEAEAYLKKMGISVSSLTDMGEYRHIFTHIEWQMHAYRVTCEQSNGEVVWRNRDAVPLPTAFKKIISANKKSSQ